MIDHLERRLAGALSDDSVTSSMLPALIAEADVAVADADADATAESERKKAFDPALSPDPRKARAAMEDKEAVELLGLQSQVSTTSLPDWRQRRPPGAQS